MPRLGDDIPLSFQLGGEETNKYVRAEVWDQDGVAIGSSPFALTHLSGGLYQRADISMPNTKKVTVRYMVFDDVGYTTRTVGYEPVIEEWELIPEPSSAATVYSYSEFDVAIDADEIDL